MPEFDEDDPPPSDQAGFDAWIETGRVVEAAKLTPVSREDAEAIRDRIRRAVRMLAESLAVPRGDAADAHD